MKNHSHIMGTSGNKNMQSFLHRAADLYVDGFRNMTVGRTLWVLIILKIIILLFVFKLFFFPDLLQNGYDNDVERAQAVRDSLTGQRQ